MKKPCCLTGFIVGMLLLFGCGGGGGGSATPKSWGTAELLENNSASDASVPQIAASTNGSVITVWRQSDGTNYSNYASRFNGTSWGAPELIEASALSAYYPWIALDDAGNGMAVWPQFDGTYDSINANRFDAASLSWTGSGLIETAIGAVGAPQVAFYDTGLAIAVWQQVVGSNHSIYTSRFNGTSWTMPVVLESNAGNAYAPALSVNASGNLMAIWRQYNGSSNGIYVNRFDPATQSWAGTVQIAAGDTTSAMTPGISLDADGNAMAVWEQFDGIDYTVLASRFDAATQSWGSAEQIDAAGSSNAYDPAIACDSAGNAMAVWKEYDHSYYSIYANRFDVATQSWGGAEMIESGSAGNADSPRIVLDEVGNAIAVWFQSNGTINNIWANRFDGTSWGSPERIDAGDSDADSVQITLDGHGNATAVWVQDDGSYYSVYVNCFE